MKSPKQAYKDNVKDPKIQKYYRELFNDIYITDTRPKTGLGETDEESLILKTGKFIPGKIYTYKYDPLYKDVLDYYDTRPIVLVNNTFRAGTGNYIVQGINLNFLPERVRVATLEQFFETFKSDILESNLAAHHRKINLSVPKILSFFKNWRSVLSLFNGKAGVGYQFAYRNYIIDRIERPRYIEYQHWEIIPFLQPREMVGASIDKIYKDYWRSKRKK